MDLISIGWREWISLPELNIDNIKAKIDTGARTSAIHAFQLKPFKQNNTHKIRFSIHPLQQNNEKIMTCIADISDIRWVTDSGGHREKRYVIHTLMKLGKLKTQIEITLTNRDTMKFRMLLGRRALINHFIVNPANSYMQSDEA